VLADAVVASLPGQLQVWWEVPVKDSTGHIIHVSMMPYTGKKPTSRWLAVLLARALQREDVGFELRAVNGTVLHKQAGRWQRAVEQEKHGAQTKGC
jgi:hypothetical protein